MTFYNGDGESPNHADPKRGQRRLDHEDTGQRRTLQLIQTAGDSRYSRDGRC